MPQPRLIHSEQGEEAGFRSRQPARDLPSGGGGGTYDGMDGWQTSVENRLQSVDTRLLHLDGKVETLRRDMDGQFRLTWAGLIAGFLITWGGLIWGFLWLAEKLPR